MTELGGRYIVAFDWPLIAELVERAGSDPDVDAVQIEDALSQRTFGELGNWTKEHAKDYVRDITQDGSIVGRVRVVVDESALRQTLSWLRAFIMFAAAAIVVVVSGLALMLIRTRAHAKAIQREVAERRKAEESLLKLSMAVEQSPASVIITDKNSVIEYVNPRFLQVTGYAEEEVIGGNPRILNSGLTPKETIKDLWKTLASGKEWRGEFHNRKKNGETFWEYASVSPIRAPDGSITHFLAVKEDITLRKDYEKTLVRQANYDSLTGLANRLLARDRLDQAISEGVVTNPLLACSLSIWITSRRSTTHWDMTQATSCSWRRHVVFNIALENRTPLHGQTRRRNQGLSLDSVATNLP